MTEQEFVDWVGDGWAEWVNGEVIIMSVNFEHAEIFSFLLRLFGDFADDRDLGRVLSEPFQIRFARQKSRRSPDLFFVSNQAASKIREQNLEGAPDLILEIISPDSQSRDRREKYLEYESASVPEYFIVDPISKSVEAYTLGKDRKYQRIEPKNGAIHSKVLAGFYLKPEWLWRPKLPKVSVILREIKRKR
jgi:Uma2 family endonuclease